MTLVISQQACTHPAFILRRTRQIESDTNFTRSMRQPCLTVHCIGVSTWGPQYCTFRSAVPSSFSSLARQSKTNSDKVWWQLRLAKQLTDRSPAVRPLSSLGTQCIDAHHTTLTGGAETFLTRTSARPTGDQLLTN